MRCGTFGWWFTMRPQRHDEDRTYISRSLEYCLIISKGNHLYISLLIPRDLSELKGLKRSSCILLPIRHTTVKQNCRALQKIKYLVNAAQVNEVNCLFSNFRVVRIDSMLVHVFAHPVCWFVCWNVTQPTFNNTDPNICSTRTAAVAQW